MVPASGLSLSDALFGAFDTMTYRVSNQMSKGLGDHIEQTLVQIGFLAAHHQCDFLSTLLGHVAHHPGKAPEQLFNRDHADLHHRALKLGQYPGLKGDGIAESSAQRFFGNVARKLGECLLQHGLSNDQFPDQVEHVVDALRVNPQNVFCECVDGV